jgi:Holliday junction DNA helicase RuvA
MAVFHLAVSATIALMITFLEGKLDTKQLARVEMNVSGVGYEVFIPLSSYDRLPLEGESCRILIYHHITEADQKLFGFCTADEREMFMKLLTISGVGPKLAISALSGLPVRELKNALINGDVKRISTISGIGKKTAERIVVELRDKFDRGDQLDAFAPVDTPAGDSRMRDAALALGALGHKPDDAAKMIKGVANKLTPKTTVEDLIRLALSK